jgi:hypothetical protein
MTKSDKRLKKVGCQPFSNCTSHSNRIKYCAIHWTDWIQFFYCFIFKCAIVVTLFDVYSSSSEIDRFWKKKWNKNVLQICFTDRCELEMAKTSHVEQYVSFMWGVVCIRRIQDLFGHTQFLKIKVMSQQLEFIGYILCIVVREYTSGHYIWIDFDPNDDWWTIASWRYVFEY